MEVLKNTQFVLCWEQREEVIGKEREGGCGRQFSSDGESGRVYGIVEEISLELERSGRWCSEQGDGGN